MGRKKEEESDRSGKEEEVEALKAKAEERKPPRVGRIRLWLDQGKVGHQVKKGGGQEKEGKPRQREDEEPCDPVGWGFGEESEGKGREDSKPEGERKEEGQGTAVQTRSFPEGSPAPSRRSR